MRTDTALPRNSLVLELAVIPIILLLRLVDHSRSVVEIGCAGTQFDTCDVGNFAAAGELRDGLLTDIQRGVLPTGEPAPAGVIQSRSPWVAFD